MSARFVRERIEIISAICYNTREKLTLEFGERSAAMGKTVDSGRVREEVLSALTKRSALSAAKRLTAGDFYDGMKYSSYFMLCAFADAEPTLRIAFSGTKSGKVSSISFSGNDLTAVIERPRSIETHLRRLGARYAVASLSYQGGGAERAAAFAQRIYESFKSVRLIDILLISDGAAFSLVRGSRFHILSNL